MRKLIFASLFFISSTLLAGTYLSGGFYACDTTVRTTSPNVATVSVVAFAANPARRGFIIWNNSSNSVYLTYGPTSTSTGPTRILASFTQFESLGGIVYTGQISAIRNAGSGTLTMTEFY